MNINEYIIQTKSLGKSYKGTKVLENLNLNVQKGSIFGFLGPNGAGKTTTMKILLGFIRSYEGSGTIFGKDINKDGIEIRSRIGYLSQDPQFYDNLSTRENLRLTTRFFFKNDKKAIDHRIDEVIDITGLSKVADRKIKGFSGGERQRLGIAQAQINNPDLLILDEPTAALDPLGRKDVLNVMEILKEKTTIFYSTHILSDVQRVSDTVAILNDGLCLAQGPIDQVMTQNSGIIFKATGRGNLERSIRELRDLPWVSDINYNHDLEKGFTDLNIEVTDSKVAEDSLLRILMKDPSTVITDFGLKMNVLEESFMNIISAGVRK